MKIPALAGLALIISVGAPALASEPNLVGTWTGNRERIAIDDGYVAGLVTMVITEQQGRTFKGHLDRTYPDKPDIDEWLLGAFTDGGDLIVGSDDEGTYAFKLVDADTLDYCYTEASAKARAVCARLMREK
jgi:hypothetical protein